MNSVIEAFMQPLDFIFSSFDYDFAQMLKLEEITY